MFGSLMLDTAGDLIEAEDTDALGGVYSTIAPVLGAAQVAQAASLRSSTKTRDAWFNRSAGIDYDGLFFNAGQSDTALNPVRSRAFREVLENTPGFASYEGDGAVTFTRSSRKLAVELPCFIVDCDNSRVVPVVIG